MDDDQGFKPEVVTTQYVFSHGKMPRGRGHWGFWIRPYHRAPDRKSELWFAPGELLYSEAREQAICRAYDLWAGDVQAVVEVAP